MLLESGQISYEFVERGVQVLQLIEAALVAQVEQGELKRHSGHYFQLRLGREGLRCPAVPEVVDHLFRLSDELFVRAVDRQRNLWLAGELNCYVLFICQYFSKL